MPHEPNGEVRAPNVELRAPDLEVSESGAYWASGPDERTTALSVVGPPTNGQRGIDSLVDPSRNNGLMGQRGQSNIPMEQAVAGLNRGAPPSIMEGYNFGALADGTPAVSFKDENGTDQVVRISGGQWLAAVTGRDSARREMQFKLDNDRKRERHAGTFTQLLENGNFSDIDQASLRMIWDINPGTAFDYMQKLDAVNRRERERTAVVGGGAALGGKQNEWLLGIYEKRGLTIPTETTQRGWDQYLSRGIELASQIKEPVFVHDEFIDPVKALPIEVVHRQTDFRALASAGSMLETLAQQRDITGVGRLETEIRMWPSLAYGLNKIGLAPSSMYEHWSKTGTTGTNMKTFVAAAHVRGGLKSLDLPALVDGAVVLDDDKVDKIMTLADTMALELGWTSAQIQDPDSRRAFAEEFVRAADYVGGYTAGDIQPQRTESELDRQRLDDASQRRIDEIKAKAAADAKVAAAKRGDDEQTQAIEEAPVVMGSIIESSGISDVDGWDMWKDRPAFQQAKYIHSLLLLRNNDKDTWSNQFTKYDSALNGLKQADIIWLVEKFGSIEKADDAETTGTE